MGKQRKLKKQAKKHGKAFAKKAAPALVAAKALKEVKKPEKKRSGGVKKVVLSAAVLAGAYAVAKKLGLFEDDKPAEEVSWHEDEPTEDYL